jgi:hypothetical protein
MNCVKSTRKLERKNFNSSESLQCKVHDCTDSANKSTDQFKTMYRVGESEILYISKEQNRGDSCFKNKRNDRLLIDQYTWTVKQIIDQYTWTVKRR